MKKLLVSAMCSVMMLGLGTVAGAATVVSQAQGYVVSNGLTNGSGPGNNSFSGVDFGEIKSSWAGFDLSSYSAGVTSAELKVVYAPYIPQKNYDLKIYDVNTAQSVFASGNAGLSGYNDLQSGKSYGTVNATSYDIMLNADAIADINAAAGKNFLMGFTNETVLNSPDLIKMINDSTTSFGAYINGWWGNPNDLPELILTYGSSPAPVPEPSTFILFAGGLLAAALARKRLNA